MQLSTIRPDTLPRAGSFVDAREIGKVAEFHPDVAREKLVLPAETGFFVPDQVHGTNVVVVDELPQPAAGEAQLVPNCDALIAYASTAAIGVRTADCLPVLIRDNATSTRAAIHAGWRGTAAGIIPQTVARLVALGSKPGDLQVWIGPAIQSCCFEVQADVASKFVGFAKEEDGKTFVLLPAAGCAQLVAAGVPASQIEISPVCTCCNPRQLPSHRRDGATRTDVLWSVIA